VLPTEQTDPRQQKLEQARQKLAAAPLAHKQAVIEQMAVERDANGGYRYTTDEMQLVSGLRNQVVCDIARAARQVDRFKVAA
jgi:hypothetical protein